MNDWVDKLGELKAVGDRVAVVTVIGTRGSSPCEPGAKMLVTSRETFGTIGGGRLEYRCTELARDLCAPGANLFIERFPLSASVGQCCGGVVDVLFEPMPDGVLEWLRSLIGFRRRHDSAVLCTNLRDGSTKFVVTEVGIHSSSAIGADTVVDQARRNLQSYRAAQRTDSWLFELVGSRGFNVAVFGAGHVGSAVVHSLSALDCEIRWIDSRQNFFADSPENVHAIERDRPAGEVDKMSAGSCYLVMTHDHDLDFQICKQILRRGDAAYCGMIGSLSKRRRFERRFLQEGLHGEIVDRLVCPIGVEGIRGKKPAEIAVSVSAQVLRAFEDFRRRPLLECAGRSHDEQHPVNREP